jgi:hypothetical protein
LLIVRKGEGEVMPVENEKPDPRDRLVREKYFCIRPRPLERWLWSKRIPSSAERVFWLHWQEGMQRTDWCSEIPLSRVANECDLDTSTVTRAYQLLIRLGCLRRTDPGRNPANPFQQATAITEVRIPRELLVELDRHPTRRTSKPTPKNPEQQGRAVVAPSAAVSLPTPPNASTAEPSLPTGLFPGLSGRERARALSQLTDQMSDPERHAYQEALRLHHATMAFDPQTHLTADARAKILAALATLATPPNTSTTPQTTARPPATPQPRSVRNLTVFELARLNRELQTAASPSQAPELLRQVTWSIQLGALKRFDTRHALNIALKKIRAGLWTRPHRMPPNWALPAAQPHTLPEPCRAA